MLQFDTFWTWASGNMMFHGQLRVHDPIYAFEQEAIKSIQGLAVGFRDFFMDRTLSCDILPVLRRAAQFSRWSAQQRANFLLREQTRKKAFNDLEEAYPCLGLRADKYHPMERFVTMSILYFVYGAFEPRAFPTASTGLRPDLTRNFIEYRPMTEAEEVCLQWM
jgi:hypothetical protein